MFFSPQFEYWYCRPDGYNTVRRELKLPKISPITVEPVGAEGLRGVGVLVQGF